MGESLGRRRDLPPPADDIDADIARVSAARDRLVATARARGEDGIADFFARYAINHPSTDAAAPFCPDCSDTGRRGRADAEGVIGIDDYFVCECCRTNPVLLQRRLEATQGGRLRHRRERAADLNPGRSEALLST